MSITEVALRNHLVVKGRADAIMIHPARCTPVGISRRAQCNGPGDATCFQQVNLPTVYTGAGLTTSPRGWTLGSYTPSAGSGAIPLFSQASASSRTPVAKRSTCLGTHRRGMPRLRTALEFMTESTALIYQRVTASPAIDSVPAET